MHVDCPFSASLNDFSTTSRKSLASKYLLPCYYPPYLLTMSNQPIPPSSILPPTQQPANVYYRRPYSFYWPGVFIFVGAFGCSGLTDTVDVGTSILLWTVYIIGFLIIVLIDPLCVAEQRQIDENGCPFTIRRPLVGFRSCEQIMPLENIERGLYHIEGADDDARLHDGYRYGYAFFRI